MIPTVPTVATRRTVAGYAVGSLATGAFGTVPGLVLLIYLTDTLSVPAAVAGLVVFLPKFFDVFWNPWVGAWSDRTVTPLVTRWGPRRPWMLVGAVLLPPLFVLMFAGPSGSAGALWVCLVFLLAGAAYGFFQVPYVGLPAELSSSPAQRTRLQTGRVVVLSLGILLGGAAAPALVQAGGSGRSGHLLMGSVVAVVLFGGMFACVALVPTTAAVPLAAADRGGSLPSALRVAAGSPRYWALYTGYVLQALAVAAALAAIPYYSRYVLHRPGWTSVLFAAFVAPSIVLVPVWRRVAARRGSRWCLLASSWLFALCALLTVPGGLVFCTVAFVGCGAAYAALQLFSYALLSDSLALVPARAGLLSGLWTASETGMFAIGPGVVGGLLGLFGFVSSSSGDAAQPASARAGIALATGALPAALVLCSIVRFRRYQEVP